MGDGGGGVNMGSVPYYVLVIETNEKLPYVYNWMCVYVCVYAFMCVCVACLYACR